MAADHYVYSFAQNAAEGGRELKSLLGGKGANLAEMTRLGLPVPPGFTVSTEACLRFLEVGGELPEEAREEVRQALALLEERMGLGFGDASNPLLVSVRSGAPISMPGMMDTVLNLGLNDESVRGLAERTGDPRFAWDSYRRFIQMYADVVLGLNPEPFERAFEQVKAEADVESDGDVPVESLQQLVATYDRLIRDKAGKPFPQDPQEQLWSAIAAVFNSWNNRRALDYRNAHDIPHDLGTAVNVQAMVFGNMGEDCATGVAFTRDPNTGEKRFFGEWLPNAQGEDVVAGIRTPQPVNEDSGAREGDRMLETELPEAYAELERVHATLEAHYKDMQDIEFTIQRGKLWMLQTRNGKRSSTAQVRIAVDMCHEELIDRAEAVQRVDTKTLEHLLHPQLDPNAERTVLTRGLGASPGAATGRAVFSAEEAAEWAGRGEQVILVRPETSPEDIQGMVKAAGIATARGGMTSHAAVVARGISKPCVVGAGELRVDVEERVAHAAGHTVREGDTITLDGGEGTVMLGEVPTVQPSSSAELDELMGWADELRRLKVYTNSDTPDSCATARGFGAEGVGLCRTEHMFFGPGSSRGQGPLEEEDRIQAMREMILADDEDGRRAALAKLEPMQAGDFRAIFREMEGLPVTIRLLDPPLHEFLPHEPREIDELARSLDTSAEQIRERIDGLHETNPMLGHRGCRLGVSYPEIYEMQARAIVEAGCLARREDGVRVQPLIMVPLVAGARELEILRDVVDTTAGRVIEEQGVEELPYEVGTMIELPRACLATDEIAGTADFVSFGTNDLTQTTFGLSRDDCGSFLPIYLDLGILDVDPFASLDSRVAELVELGTRRGRSVQPELSVGICGEHGGEPASIARCERIGLDYVSCSPYRIPIARLAAAHASLESRA